MEHKIKSTQKTTAAEVPAASQFLEQEGALSKASAEMPSQEVLVDLADLFKIFGDTTRLSILSALRQEERCVGDLATLLNMTASAISHQLRALRSNNLVTYRRDGKLIFYRLADDHVKSIIDTGLDHITELDF